MELPEHVDPDVFEDFLSRRLSMADELEHLVLDLENTGSASTRRDLKGHIHTLKGEGGVLGLMDLEGVCHAVETSRRRPFRSPQYRSAPRGDRLGTQFPASLVK